MVTVILLLAGAACFLLAAVGVVIGHVVLVPLGLLLWIVADIAGTVWPNGFPRRRP
jgi:hypothetical protein